MNRIKKLLHNNMVLIILLLVFISFGAGVTYSATTYLYNSNVIGYDNGNSGLTSTDVQGALDELYEKTSTCGECPDGYVCYEKIAPLSFFSENAVSDAIASTYVTSSTGINFGAISSDTNGKGLYLLNGSEIEGNPIYYYRGAVTNNNVLFAGFCWRMVRTTETGGIKMIYNGTESSGRCLNTTGTITQIGSSTFNSSHAGMGYVGYTYGTNYATNSTIKSAIDNWYATYMTDYTSYLEDTVWCNDRSYTYSGGNYLFGAYSRIYSNKNPSLKCLNDIDKYTVSEENGNGLLTYPVGLLTADEVSYAGGLMNTNNSTYYLNNGQAWYTMSPFDYYEGYAVGFTCESKIYWKWVSNGAGIRPAISLKSGVSFIKGDGTGEKPYVVE